MLPIVQRCSQQSRQWTRATSLLVGQRVRHCAVFCPLLYGVSHPVFRFAWTECGHLRSARDRRVYGKLALRYTGPASKADDVVFILQKLQTDPAVDAHRIGVWGFSNGGWVAPIVAARFPLAFMILKSASRESIAENVLYEVGQVLREHGRFTTEQTSQALAFERTMLSALQTNSNWSAAKR